MTLYTRKSKAFQRRLDLLHEEYEAATNQFSQTLSDVDRLRIQRQIASLEKEMQDLEQLLGVSQAEQTAKSFTAEKSNNQSRKSGITYGTGRRWAVLVGVNTYEDRMNYGALQVCTADTTALHDYLVGGGYDVERVHLLTDSSSELPTRNKILATLKSIADNSELDDLLLFYYSGHGDEKGGESYIVGRDGHRVVLEDTGVPISRIKRIMEDAPARAKIIILDACHSGANIGGKGPATMTPEFIQRVFEEAEGMAILASCKQGELSYEWPAEQRSVFTHFLLAALEGKADLDNKGFVTVQDANRYIVDGVKLWASQHHVNQTPTLNYTVAGDIVLVKNST